MRGYLALDLWFRLWYRCWFECKRLWEASTGLYIPFDLLKLYMILSSAKVLVPRKEQCSLSLVNEVLQDTRCCTSK